MHVALFAENQLTCPSHNATILYSVTKVHLTNTHGHRTCGMFCYYIIW